MRTQYGTYEAPIDTRAPKTNRLTGWFFKSVYAGSTTEANRRAFDCYFVV